MFRYLDARGIQKRLAHENDLADAIRRGDVNDRTMFAEGESGAWQPAGRHPAYQRVVQMHGLKTKAGTRAASRGPRPGVLGLLSALPPKAKVAGALVAVLLLLVGFQMRSRMQREATLDLLQQALIDLGEGRRPSAEALAIESPSDNTAKMLWIRVFAEHDVLVEADSALAAQGIAGFEPPADWMTVDYIRNPDAYPEVLRHWEAYNRFFVSFANRIPSRLDNRILKRGAQVGLRAPFTNEINERVEADLPGRMAPYHRRHGIADASISLHRRLADAGGRVVYASGGGFEFEEGQAAGVFNSYLPSLRSGVADLPEFESTLTDEQRAVLNAPSARRLGAEADARAREQQRAEVQRALDRSSLRNRPRAN